MCPQRRRRCLHCGELFEPDCRNRRHQRHCQKPCCRKASKAASQRRWLNKPASRAYFRGPENVGRVRRWRRAHPGYWRPRQRSLESLNHIQTVASQRVEPCQSSCNAESLALQDHWSMQPPLVVGLIATLIDPLQESIAGYARRLIVRGQDILRAEGGARRKQQSGGPEHETQNPAAAGAAAAHSPAV